MSDINDPRRVPIDPGMATSVVYTGYCSNCEELERELAAAMEENEFLHAALDAFQWQRINLQSVEEVKEELLAEGYTEEQLSAFIERCRATVERAKQRAAIDAASKEGKP